MKILKKKKKKKKNFFFFFFLRLGFFFSNWEKSHLNPIGKGAEFRPLRTPKKNPCSLVFLSRVYFVKVIHLREDMENFAKSVQCQGTIFVILKQWGCALQIKVARDQGKCFSF